jgi:hypothetical protein
MFPHLDWRICGATLLLVLAAQVAEARQIAASFDELRFVVKQGDTVTVTDSLGRKTNGSIAHLSPSSLALLTRDGERNISQADVVTISRRRHGNLATGAIVGLVTGAAFGSLLVAADDCYSCGPAVYAWAAAACGGIGSGLGVAVSAMTWRNQIIFDRPESAAKKVKVSPVLARDRQLIGLSFQF